MGLDVSFCDETARKVSYFRGQLVTAFVSFGVQPSPKSVMCSYYQM